MQLLLEQILKNQERVEGKVDTCMEGMGKIREQLRDGSGMHKAIKNWQDGHDKYHDIREREAKADAAAAVAKNEAGPHWLIKAAGNTAVTVVVGAIVSAGFWMFLKGAIEYAPSTKVQRTETITTQAGHQ